MSEIFIELPESSPVWAPSADQVARVVPNYTRGGFDDDGPQAGAEQGGFTDSTSPPLDHVEALIATVCEEIIGLVVVEIPTRCHGLARSCAIHGVAAAISTGKIPAQTDDARGETQGHVAAYLRDLEMLQKTAPQPTALRVT
jgi:hypothetical protein